MKRFVTYIYEYEGKKRRQNAGHIRTDLREEGSLLEVHVRLNDRTEDLGKIFLIADNASPVGIPAGELVLSRGQGHVRLSFPQNILGKSGYAMAQLIAFAVRFEDGRMLVASFAGESGERAACGEFRVWEPEVEEEVPSSVGDNVELPVEPPEEDDSPQIACRRIALTDLVSLPGANRQLCRNSFLVHGFFNYRYLIEKNITKYGRTDRYIGVPGLYSPQEQKFAEMYGFPDFDHAGPETNDENPTENFGYWLRPL